MSAEEIKGLMEAYSKVNETPEVPENLNEAPKTDYQAGGGNAASNKLSWWQKGFDGGKGEIERRGREALYKKGGGDAAILKGPTVNRNGVNVTTLTRDDIITRGRYAERKPTSTPPGANDLYRDGRNVFDGTPDPRANRPSGNPSRNPPPVPGNGSGGTGRSTPSNVISAKNIAGQQQKVTVGKGYEATLGGQKGKVTYDASGKRTFKADTSTTPTPTSTPTNQGKPTTPPAAPQKPKGSAMDQWRAANPKLAAAADEKARIRGTSQTDNPLIDKEMRARMPMTPSVQSPTLQKDLGNLAKNYTSLTQNPNASKAATPKPTPTPTPAATTATDTIKKSSTTKPTMKESNLDAFDLVKEYLLDEGYAETEQNAMVIMVNMSEEWRSEILDELYKGKHGQSEKEYMAGRSDAGKRISGDEKEGPASYASRWHKGSEPTKPGQKPKNVQKLAKWEKDHLEIRKNDLKKKEEEKKVAKEEIELDEAQRARENPEGHDKEEKRKYEPVRGEKTPMPPRGDKRREEFEKWYAKQMGR